MKTSTKKIAKRQSSPMSRANRVSLLHDSRSLISRDYGTVSILMPERLRQVISITLLPSIKRDLNKQNKKNKKQNGVCATIKKGNLALQSDSDVITTQSIDTGDGAAANFEMRDREEIFFPTSKKNLIRTASFVSGR